VLRCSGAEVPDAGTCLYVDLLRHVDLGVVVADLELGQIVFRNEQAAEVLASLGSGEGCAAIQTLLASSATASTGGGSRTTRIGSRLIGFTPHRLPDGKVVVFLRDVTEKLRLEAIAEAASHMDNIGYIFSGIRHEIGNPLNSLKMTLSVLRKNLGSFSEASIREYIERAFGEVARIEELLQGLKSFNMFERPRPRPLELEPFLASFLSLVRKDLQEKGIGLDVTIDPAASRIVADPRALQQVMLNLLNNAADALDGSIVAEIRVRATRAGGRVQLVVEDEGCGIPSAQQRHLFRPFFTSKAHGSGLGLVIVKKLLVEMDGDIEIVSQEGIGTSVTLSLVGDPG
jgi:signal transduction histidine kinase